MKSKSDKETFIEACLSNDLQKWYEDYLLLNPSKIQLFNEVKTSTSDEIRYSHKQWSPSNKCSITNEDLNQENIDILISYWSPFVWKPIRKDLLNETRRQEAYECQKIDCSCNDCKFLIRKLSYCFKLNKETKVGSNQCFPENQTCFIHRLDKVEI